MNEDNISKITVGMTADELFEIFPQSLQVKKPDTWVDENDPEKHLIVMHHYPGVDVRLEFAKSGDPVMPLNSYCVTEVSRV